MSVPFKIVDVDDDLNKELMANFTCERKTYLKVGESEILLPSPYRELAADIYNHKPRPEDVWICTFPRSGTTLTQEMMWMIANDLNFEGAELFAVHERFPHLELGAFMSDELKQEVIELNGHDEEGRLVAERLGENLIDLLDLIPGTRYVKSHLPLSLLPPTLVDTCKVVYVARNPKDMAVSFYHLCRFLKQVGYTGDFDTFWDYIERGVAPWTPYWENIRQAWALKDHPNMLFLFYESIIKDIKGTIHTVAKHLGKALTEEQVDKLANYLHIENFRKNPSVNLEMLNIPDLFKQDEEGFVRKGKSGGWKEYFSPELSARADKWIAENIKKIPGFAYPEP